MATKMIKLFTKDKDIKIAKNIPNPISDLISLASNVGKFNFYRAFHP
jgi:hypothetical protein